MATATRTSTRRIALCIALAALTLAVYHPVGGFEYINFDDPSYVVNNAHVQQGLTWQGVGWAFTTGTLSNWHPLTWLSLMLDVELFGIDAGAQHLVNVGLHLINVLLLYLLIVFLAKLDGASFIVAALFAVHPMHVESVAWISERKDVLSTTFWILTTIAYARYARSGKRAALLSSLVLFALGLMTKPMLVTLPFTLILLDYWPLGRMPLTPRPDGKSLFDDVSPLIREKAPYFILALISIIVTFLAQHGGGAVSDAYSPSERLANGVLSYGRYIWKTFWPADLAIFYPHPAGSSAGFSPIGVSLACLTLAMLIAVICLSVRRRPYVAVGGLWFLGTLVPVIGIVQVGGQAMADRYTYVPHIGLFIAIVWACQDLLSPLRLGKIIGGIAATGAVAGCVLVARQQVTYWQDSSTLFTRALDVTTENTLALNQMAEVHLLRRDYPAALKYTEPLVALRPDWYPARVNHAIALQHTGDVAGAESHLGTIIKADPDNWRAHAQLATILYDRGEVTDALKHLDRATSLAPESPGPFELKGEILQQRGDLRGALSALGAVVDLQPLNADARRRLGLLKAMTGDVSGGLQALRDAVRIDPKSVVALNQLAWILATHPSEAVANPGEAVEIAERAVQLSNSRDPAALDTLAAALARLGLYDQAQSTARQAIDVAREGADASVARRIENRLHRYSRGEPYLMIEATAPATNPAG